MNKEYTYQDGKVRVIDESGKESSPIPYSENLNQILVQENTIEIIENKIAEISEEKREVTKDKKSALIEVFIPYTSVSAGLSIIPLLTKYCIVGGGKISAGVANETILKLFGDISINQLLFLILGPIFAIYGGIFTLNFIARYKKIKRKEKGLEKQLDYLQKQTILEKNRLEQLKDTNEEIWETNTNYRIVKIDDSKTLEEIKNKLKLYYDLGYRIKRYSKLLERGKLEQKLRKYYSNEEVKIIRDRLLDEEGPALTLSQK